MLESILLFLFSGNFRLNLCTYFGVKTCMWRSWKFSSAALRQGSSKLGQSICADGPLSDNVTNPVYKDHRFSTHINHTVQSMNVN